MMEMIEMNENKKTDKLRLLVNRKTWDTYEVEQLMNNYETAIEIEEE